jgi:hypothetical protein
MNSDFTEWEKDINFKSLTVFVERVFLQNKSRNYHYPNP